MMRTGKSVIEGFRLSPPQQHLWSLQQQEDREVYRSRCVVMLDGDLQLEILRTAVADVISRHEILRSWFHSEADEMAVQVIAESAQPSIRYLDLSALVEVEQAAEIAKLSSEMNCPNFDLGQCPLMRMTVVTLQPRRHLLHLCLPALCADHAGLSNLVEEISNAYAARVRGAALSGEPMQYVELSEWQHELLESDDTKAGRYYWSKQDFSSLATLKLPFEIHSAVHRFTPLKLTSPLSPELLGRIESRTRRNQISTAVFFLSCWQVLLSRLADQRDIIVGTAFDGREYEDLVKVIGLVAKFLPVHSCMQRGLVFSELLKRVDESVREISSKQQYFDIDQVMKIKGKDEGASFFPYAFEFEEEPAQARAASVGFSMLSREVCFDRFKVKLSCIHEQESLVTEFHFDANSFSVEGVSYLARSFHTLLQSAVDNWDGVIDELQILSEVDRRRVLVEINETGGEYSLEECLHELFEGQVERRPEGVAVVFGKEEVSYGELNRRANQLAHYLRRRGVGPETLVGMMIERSIEMVVGVLGILKAGGGYLPLDASYPRERLRYMVRDAGVRVILTERGLASEVLEGGESEVVDLYGARAEIAAEQEENPESSAGPENLAYVIYTSGSSGKPKGVMIPHRGICNRVLWMQQAFGFSAADRFLQKTPISFDAAGWELFVPLFIGAQVVLAQPGGHQDCAYLVRTVVEQEVTVLQLVPSMLQVLLEQAGVGECRSLRWMFCGGEVLPPQLRERFYERMKGRLCNLYGPTEVSIDASYWECEHGSGEGLVPIGRPLTNMQMYVVDEEMAVVPVGVVGELYIGGRGVGRGYLGRAELTAESFMPDSLSGRAGERLYRSGDLGRYLADGNIEYVGRADEQVKVRGYRIELGEVETVLREHGQVQECVVVAREDEEGEKRLVAYVVEQGEGAGASVSVKEWREYLKQRLPEYMIPSSYVRLEQLPLTVNGKIDRRALPAPDGARPELGVDFVAPRGEVELRVAGVWAEVLGITEVGVEDNFFEMGGHSLQMIRVQGKLQALFDRELPLVRLFEYSTVRRLAKYLNEGEGKNRMSEQVHDRLRKQEEALEQQRRFMEQRKRTHG